MKNINIPDSEYPLFQKVYKERYDSIMEKLHPLQKELDELRPLFEQLGIIEKFDNKGTTELTKNPATFEIMEDGYNPKWSWLRKVEFILDMKQTPLTSVLLIDEICKREPGLNKIKLRNSIPATLSLAAKDKKIKRKLNDRKEYEYWISDEPY